MRLNPKWMGEQKDLIRHHLQYNTPVEWILSVPLAKKWLISYLIEENIPHRVINCGGGVTKVTTNVDVCPHCKGKGYI